MGLKSAMSAHIYIKNNELRFASVIHNAGVGGSSPPVATIISPFDCYCGINVSKPVTSNPSPSDQIAQAAISITVNRNR